MQKKLIALAVAGLVAAPAFAQSNVTIYGLVDYGFMNRSGDSGGVAKTNGRSEFVGGGAAGNRIGFKGTEDLGNGLKAIFELEYGFSSDEDSTYDNTTTPRTAKSSAGFTSNRHSYVGLTGGFGTVVGGRLDGVRYGVYGLYDPFANGGVANFTQMTTQYDRADNAVAYISPTFSGFGLVLAYATNTQGGEGAGTATCNTKDAVVNNGGHASSTGNDCDDRLKTIMLTYDNGPFSARADYETTTTQGAHDGRLYVATFGASYDFGVVKISGVYDIIKGDEGSFIGPLSGASSGKYDRKNWFVAAKMPLGAFTLMANYGHVSDEELDDDGLDAGADKWGIGVDYNFSKRTKLYAQYSQIHNDDDATYTISNSATTNGAGYGTRAAIVGIQHKF